MGLFSFLFRQKSPIVRTSSVLSCPYSSPYVILDVETTGLNPFSDRIIQLSAIKYDIQGSPVDFYNTYINPQCAIPPAASRINGITNKMVASAPTIIDISKKFLSFVGDSLIVGYNVNFDLRFLNQAFCGDFNSRQYVDVLAMARQLLSMPNYKLETVATCLGYRPATSFHDSFSDCEAVASILYHVAEDLASWIESFNPFPSPTHFEKAPVLFRQDNFSFNDEGFQYWFQGDAERKSGNIEKALQLFERSRESGYDCPAIYESYAMAYRKLKDYEKEIQILDEAIQHFQGSVADCFEYRKSRATALLLAKHNREKELQRISEEKAKKAEARQKRLAEAASRQKKPLGRSIIQCTDNGEIVKEYDSVASAAKEIGVSTKCIRDAANGKQKHAGGFCWRYNSPSPLDGEDV